MVSPNKKRAPGALVRLTAAALLGAGLFGATVPAIAGDKIIWGSPNPRGLNVGWSPFFLAVERGFFKAEGIDEVDVVTFNGTATLLPQVVNKSVTIGSPNADIPIISQQPGRDSMPLTFFYNFMRASVWEIAVPAGSPIKTLGDLRGKNIGVGALTWANVPTTKAMLKEAGLIEGKDVTLVAVGAGGPAFQAFNKGEIDALNLYDTAHAGLERSGTAIRRLDLPEKYSNLFSTGFITHRDFIEEKADILAGFGRALAKGTVACYANPEACVKAYYKANPSKKPKPGEEAEKMAKDIAILQTRGQSYLSFPNAGDPQYGSYPETAFSDYVDVLYAQGGVETRDIPVDQLFTNDFVGTFNDFDKDSLAAEAKTW